MMRHNERFFTFQDAYLNQHVNFDLQNAFLEEEMENQMFRLFAHVSLTRDPRAARDMVPPQVWANLAPDPEITALEERRAELRQGHYRFEGQENEAEIRTLTATIQSKRLQRQRWIVKQYRENYFHHRPTWDIEKQARGERMEQFVEPAIDLGIPERARLAEILCHQPENLSDEAMTDLSIKVVNLYVALCGKRETGKHKRPRPPMDVKPPITFERMQLEPELDPELKPDPFPLLLGANQCPDCIGDERLTKEAQTFSYCRPTKRNDHFDDHHLKDRERAEQRGELIKCRHPQCEKVSLRSVDQFRNHVEAVHGVKLRPSGQAEQRQQKLEGQRSRPPS
jgi:hypothetical protein